MFVVLTQSKQNYVSLVSNFCEIAKLLVRYEGFISNYKRFDLGHFGLKYVIFEIPTSSNNQRRPLLIQTFYVKRLLPIELFVWCCDLPLLRIVIFDAPSVVYERVDEWAGVLRWLRNYVDRWCFEQILLREGITERIVIPILKICTHAFHRLLSTDPHFYVRLLLLKWGINICLERGAHW